MLFGGLGHRQGRIAFCLTQVICDYGVVGLKGLGRAEVIPTLLEALQFEQRATAIEQGLQLVWLERQSFIDGLDRFPPGFSFVETTPKVVPGVGNVWVLHDCSAEQGLSFRQSVEPGQGLALPCRTEGILGMGLEKRIRVGQEAAPVLGQPGLGAGIGEAIGSAQASVFGMGLGGFGMAAQVSKGLGTV